MFCVNSRLTTFWNQTLLCLSPCNMSISNLSIVMAVIDKVETNTETDPNRGNILHKRGVVCHGQKLWSWNFWTSDNRAMEVSPVFNFCESERHRNPTLPQIWYSKVHNQKVSRILELKTFLTFQTRYTPGISQVGPTHDSSNHQNIFNGGTWPHQLKVAFQYRFQIFRNFTYYEDTVERKNNIDGWTWKAKRMIECCQTMHWSLCNIFWEF